MVDMAAGILNGQWLGPYNAVKLMKGAAFPVFLAAANVSGISYLHFLDLTNTAACLFFTWQIRDLIRDRRLLLVFFTAILFDPCSYSRYAFQRVYRSSITWFEVLFIFGAYLGLYCKMLERKKTGRWERGLMGEYLTAAAGAAALAFFWNTREEGMWILPFVLTASALIIAIPAGAFRRGETGAARLFFSAFCLLLFPAAVLSANMAVKKLNRQYYGEEVRLEEIDGTFGDTLKTIYSVKNRTEIPYVSVSGEKLERLCRISPSLAGIRPELDQRLDYYDAIDRGGEDGETEDGWFFWALRQAAFDAGETVTLPQSQRFWEQMREEILAALVDPASGLEEQPVMPSSLMSPFRPVYLRELPPVFAKAVRFMITYQITVSLWGPSGKESLEACELFRRVTGNQEAAKDPQGQLPPQARWIERLLNVYQLLNPVAAAAAAVSILLLLIRSLADHTRAHIPCLLTICGLLLSAAALLFGVCYTEISAFQAVNCLYLSGAYPLMLAGFWIAILYTVRLLVVRKKTGHSLQSRMERNK